MVIIVITRVSILYIVAHAFNSGSTCPVMHIHTCAWFCIAISNFDGFTLAVHFLSIFSNHTFPHPGLSSSATGLATWSPLLPIGEPIHRGRFLFCKTFESLISTLTIVMLSYHMQHSIVQEVGQFCHYLDTGDHQHLGSYR